VRRALALAVCISTALPGLAEAYERSHTENGLPLFWCTRKVPFVVNEKGSKDAGSGTFQAVSTSYFAWAAPMCTDLTLEAQGTTARSDVGFDQSGTDNTNLVVWRETSCSKAAPAGDICLKEGGCNNKYDCWEQSAQTIAVTTTTYNKATGEIYDADIEFNGAGFVFTTLDAPPCTTTPGRPATCVATDVQNTVTHEVGHVLGLDHPSGVESTMYAQATLGEVKKRTLHQDDIDGLCFIYPRGKQTTECTRQPAGCGCGAAGAAPGCLMLALPLLLNALRRRRS